MLIKTKTGGENFLDFFVIHFRFLQFFRDKYLEAR